MRKLFALTALFALVFTACPLDDNSSGGNENGDNPNNPVTTLTIKNESSVSVANVRWNNATVVAAGKWLEPGSSATVDVNDGSGFIFFDAGISTAYVPLRTSSLLVVTENEQRVFEIKNATTVVEVASPSIVFTIESFLNKINNPEGLYLPSHNEILANLNAIGNGINNVRILSYQLMHNLLWSNVIDGKENDGTNFTRESRINIEVGYTGPVSDTDVLKILNRLFINFTNANTVVSGGMTFPLPTHLQIQQAVMALDGAGTTKDVVATNYIVNGSFIFDGYEVARPYGAVVEITVRYTTTILTQARVRTEVIRIFATAGFNNVTVDAAIW